MINGPNGPLLAHEGYCLGGFAGRSPRWLPIEAGGAAILYEMTKNLAIYVLQGGQGNDITERLG